MDPYCRPPTLVRPYQSFVDTILPLTVTFPRLPPFPRYCSNHGIQCGDFANWLRTLIEDTFSSNKVDMVIQCHEHSMERSYPLYKGVVQAKNYTDPTAPVYIVNGAGGNREGNTNPNPEPWVVYHSSEIGFGLITVSGPSKLQWQFMHASGSVLDEFEITKA